MTAVAYGVVLLLIFRTLPSQSLIVVARFGHRDCLLNKSLLATNL